MDPDGTSAGEAPARLPAVLFDEEVDRGVVTALRSIGLEAVHARDVIDAGAGDEALGWLSRTQRAPLVVVGEVQGDWSRLERLGLPACGLFVIDPALGRSPRRLLAALLEGWPALRATCRTVRPPFAMRVGRRRRDWRRLDTWGREP